MVINIPDAGFTTSKPQADALSRCEWSGDWMLLWLWAGVFLTIGRAMQVVYLNHGGNVGIEDFKAIGLLVSPIFYMKKSLADMSRIEEVALNRECKVALEGLDSGFVQIGDEKGIKAMDESAFVALARHRREIHAGSDGSEKLWHVVIIFGALRRPGLLGLFVPVYFFVFGSRIGCEK